MVKQSVGLQLTIFSDIVYKPYGFQVIKTLFDVLNTIIVVSDDRLVVCLILYWVNDYDLFSHTIASSLIIIT